MSRSDVFDPALAARGAQRIAWASRGMSAMARLRERFRAERPLAGARVVVCLHVTPETGVLVQTLIAGGAAVAVAAANPLSTADDVAAALADQASAVFARRGAQRATYYEHITAALTLWSDPPHVVLDDGCDLVTTLHTAFPELADQVVGGCEQTTTGVLRLRGLAAAGALRFPMIAVDDTPAKRLLDNRYGTGQSTIEAVLRSTGILLAGRTVVVAGYGDCGRGIAARARGLGAQVVVTEVDPLPALHAALDGYAVLPMLAAAARADVLVTATGNRDVVRREHLAVLPDGAVLANAGHFDVEIDVRALHEASVSVEPARAGAAMHRLADGRTIVLLGEGRVVNLAAAEGHPAAVMDLVYAEEALAVEWLLTRPPGELSPGVLAVPADIDAAVAGLALDAMGVRIDELTADQRHYLRSWHYGS